MLSDGSTCTPYSTVLHDVDWPEHGEAVEVEHSARQINGHAMCMSKQSDLGVRVTRITKNVWQIVLPTHRGGSRTTCVERLEPMLMSLLAFNC